MIQERSIEKSQNIALALRIHFTPFNVEVIVLTVWKRKVIECRRHVCGILEVITDSQVDKLKHFKASIFENSIVKYSMMYSTLNLEENYFNKGNGAQVSAKM